MQLKIGSASATRFDCLFAKNLFSRKL